MRKLSILPLLAITALLFNSCKKQIAQSPPVVTAQTFGETVSVKIAQGESYTFSFSQAGNVTISRQAAHFSVSETQQTEGNPLYKYTPVANYAGEDEVVLQFDRSSSASASTDAGSSGCASHTSATASSSYTTLKIVVGE
jgi:hypothetical protein